MEKSSDGLTISDGNSYRARPSTDRLLSSSAGPGKGSKTPSFPSTSSQAVPLPGSESSSRECIKELVRGIKRKFESYKNEAHIRKRQKTYHYSYTVRSRGVKRKYASDHLEQPRKRFKATTSDDIEQPEIENKSSDNGCNSCLNVDSYVACSDSSESEDISNSLPEAGSSKDVSLEEPCDAQNEQADDGKSCPVSCVCKVGHSRLPAPIERYFETAVPLYKCLLMRRLHSPSNRQYACCETCCARRNIQQRIMRVALYHMTEDYDQSDLRVTRYSWGEWRE
ncbi:uncharacterized protein LOC123562956 [Mercenaria mercenaria]|uniref:uncharacterized protein LOC123562956 n=1 Tax=Mercenaria mercenaria TaxID=6596 RepID=UPI00234FAB7C|nr:uncharacterized protein LOC123562956 [Mercenaria mercenaria]